MARLTRSQIAEEVEAFIEASGPIIRQSINRYINIAGRRVYHAYEWEEREKLYEFQSVSPYSTGTVAVTNGSKTVTGTSTVWSTCGMKAGDKFAVSIGSSPYRIDTVDSDTQITLDLAYLGEDATANAYLLYKDEYDLPTPASKVGQLWLLRDSDTMQPAHVNPMTLRQISMVPNDTDVPLYFTEIESDPDSGIDRIMIRPVADQAYNMALEYLAGWSDLTADDQTHPFSPEREEIFILAVCLWAQRLVTGLSLITESELEAKMSLSFDRNKKSGRRGWRRRPFDQSARKPVPAFDWSLLKS